MDVSARQCTRPCCSAARQCHGMAAKVRDQLQIHSFRGRIGANSVHCVSHPLICGAGAGGNFDRVLKKHFGCNPYDGWSVNPCDVHSPGSVFSAHFQTPPQHRSTSLGAPLTAPIVLGSPVQCNCSGDKIKGSQCPTTG